MALGWCNTVGCTYNCLMGWFGYVFRFFAFVLVWFGICSLGVCGCCLFAICFLVVLIGGYFLLFRYVVLFGDLVWFVDLFCGCLFGLLLISVLGWFDRFVGCFAGLFCYNC